MVASAVYTKRTLRLHEAFPSDSLSIPITGLTGEVESDKARSIFQVCRLCGALVLESMKLIHVMAFDHDGEEILASVDLVGYVPGAPMPHQQNQ